MSGPATTGYERRSEDDGVRAGAKGGGRLLSTVNVAIVVSIEPSVSVTLMEIECDPSDNVAKL
ncbi:MAG: hypothetical protein ACXWXS_06645 [Actinomycetota bacterium]